jgi:diacylglycerol kinase family enzyme
MQYHLDGEPGMIEGAVEIGMMPGALRVRA